MMRRAWAAWSRLTWRLFGWRDEDVLVRHSTRQEARQQARRLTVGVAAYMIAGVATVYVLSAYGGTPWGVTAGLVGGHIVARSATSRLRAASAYRSGWLEGRSAMVSALTEAMRRDMHPVDWLRAELERDAATLGMKLPADLQRGDADG